jgi:hypothetical protein
MNVQHSKLALIGILPKGIRTSGIDQVGGDSAATERDERLLLGIGRIAES